MSAADARPHPRVAGRTTVWWGAVATIAVLSSMHATLVFASLYFRQGAPRWPPADIALPEPWAQTAVAVLGLASIAPAAWAHTQVRARTVGRLHAGALLTAGIGAVMVTLAATDLAGAGFRWSDHAFASTYWTLTGFHTLVTVVGMALLLLAPLQVWMAPLSARNRSIVVAAAVFWYYVAATWTVNVAVLQVLPRVWSA